MTRQEIAKQEESLALPEAGDALPQRPRHDGEHIGASTPPYYHSRLLRAARNVSGAAAHLFE
jgi:hypothetical protein